MSYNNGRSPDRSYRNGGHNDSYRGDRGRGGDYERGRPNSSFGSHGDRRQDSYGYRDDRRGGDKGYGDRYGREDGDSWSRGRDGDERRDSGNRGDFRGSRGYSPPRDTHRQSSTSSYSGQGYADRDEGRYERPYDRQDRGRSPPRSYDRGYDRGPERGYDRGYERGYDRRPSPRRDEDGMMRHSRSNMRDDEYGAPQGMQGSLSSIRASGSSMQVETSGTQGDYSGSGHHQGNHGESYSNLRASEPAFHQGPDMSSSGYRMTSSSFQTNPPPFGRHELAESTASFSISRAQTVPLEGYYSSSSSNAPSSAPTAANSTLNTVPPTDKVNAMLVAKLRSLATDLSVLDAEEQASFRNAINSCATSLVSSHSMDTDCERGSGKALQNFKAIDRAERDLADSLAEYYKLDYHSRLIEGDFNETTRVLSHLEMPDGDWPEPNWNFPPQRSLYHPSAEEDSSSYSSYEHVQNGTMAV